MELSRERSFTEHMQSKLLECEQASTDLENKLSALEERWQPKGLHMEQRQDEVRMIHEALKKCIEEQNDVAYVCGMIEDEMQTLEDRCDLLEMHNKDSEERIKEYTATIEEIKNDNEKMSLSLNLAGEKIKKLREMNSGMMLQLGGQKYHQGAKLKHPACAPAHGK